MLNTFLYLSVSNAQNATLMVPVGHLQQINDIAFSPDGKYIATAGDDHTLIIWDIKTSMELKRFVISSNTFKQLLFSPDGKYFFTLEDAARGFGLNLTCKMYELSTGRIKRKFPFTCRPGFKITSDGKYLLVKYLTQKLEGSEVNDALALWDIEKNEKVAVYDIPFESTVEISPDGKYFIATGKIFKLNYSNKDNYVIQIWGITTNISNDDAAKKSPGRNGHLPLKSFEIDKSVESIAISPNGKNFVTHTRKEGIKLWHVNIDTPILVKSLSSGNIIDLQYSGDGKKLMVYSTGNEIKILNTSSFSEEGFIKLPKHDQSQKLRYSPDGKYIAAEKNNLVYLFDSNNGKEPKVLRGYSFQTPIYSFSKDSKAILTHHYGSYGDTSGNNPKAKELGNALERKVRMDLARNPNDSNSKSLEWVLQTNARMEAKKKNVRIWLPDIGKVYNYDPGNLEFGTDTITGNKKYILTSDFLSSGNYFKNNDSIKATTDEVRYLLMHDPNSPLRRSYTPEVKLINIQTRDTVLLIPIDSADWIMVDNKGYYMTSKNGAKYLHFVTEKDVYLFDQFDLQYNRPDILLSKIGDAPGELIDSYKRAYEKRMKRMGFNPADFEKERTFNVPQLLITNGYDLPITVNSEEVIIKINASDSINKLDRINVWVNGIAIYGMQGISLKNKNLHRYQDALRVNLTAGKNKIQLSTLNDRGVESYRDQVEVNYQPQSPPLQNIYFIGIGTTRYKDSLYNLSYPAKDIRDLCALIKNKYPGAIIDTLINEKVTRNNVLALKKRLVNTSIEDKVIVSVSGHGLLDKNLDFYYATHDLDFSEPKANGVRYEDLEDLLDGIPARKKLLIMDACHSGELDKDNLQNGRDSKLSTIDKDVREVYKGARGVGVTNEGIGLQNSFELMQQLFADISRGSGAQVISAASGNGYAFEDRKWNNGVFTYCILKGLSEKEADINRDAKISISELRDYVSQQVERLTGGRQKPTVRRENIDFDWVLW